MRQMVRSVAFYSLATCLTGCDTLSEWNAHPDSYFTRDEKVSIQFYRQVETNDQGIPVETNDPNDKDIPAECKKDPTLSTVSVQLGKETASTGKNYSFGALAGAAIAAAVGVAVDQTVKALEEEKTRFTAKFSARRTDTFYEKAGRVKYKCFSITRKNGDEVAMKYVAKFEFSDDRTAMRIVPVYIYYPHLKAKALWSDDKASVAMTIDFRSVWKDKNGTFHNEPTAAVALANQSLPIGKRDPLFGKALDDSDWLKSDWLIPVVPSHITKPASDTKQVPDSGNFTMTVTVIETTTTGADIAGYIAETLRGHKNEIVGLSIDELSEPAADNKEQQ